MKKVILLISVVYFCKLAFAGEGYTATVSNMTCPSCAGKVETELLKNKKISKVSIDMSSGKVKILIVKKQILSIPIRFKNS